VLPISGGVNGRRGDVVDDLFADGRDTYLVAAASPSANR
jgi:hypothetical protein